MFSSSHASHPPPAPSVIRQSTRVARRTLRAAIIGACTIVFGLIGERALFHVASSEATARLRQAGELSSRVLLLDEQLTMSTELAAATADERWIQRYEATIPAMDEAIAKAIALAPPAVAARFDAETRVANDALVAMERSAFELIRTGAGNRARAILSGPDYAGHKWTLARGSERLMAALVADAESEMRFLMWRAAGIASGLVLLGLGGLWWVLGRGLARAERGFVQAEYALAQTLTQLNEANRHLAQQNVRFDTALDNIGQGLCFFDGASRLIVANRAFAEMYGLKPEDMPPGTALATIVAMRERIGTSRAGMAAKDYTSWRSDATRAEKDGLFRAEFPLVNGRIVAIQHCQLPGGGWVATHEDVTEQRRTEEARRRTEAALREQHDRFDAALTNMSQGLCMFDAQERLVVHNANYIELLRWPAGAVQPGLTHEELYERLIEGGVYPSSPTAAEASEAVRAKLAAGDTTPIYRETIDGRIVAVRHRAMTGGGWVATFEDVTEQRRAEAAVAYMARHDALTNLPNRVLLHEHLAEALGWVGEDDAPEAGLAVLCLDLDHFKPVNDTLGHPVGDALLCDVARRVEGAVAAADGFSAVVARLGGDEFAVVLSPRPNGSREPGSLREAVAAFAGRLVAEISRPYDLQGHEVVVGASVGFALAPEDGRDPFELLKMADLALYRAKAGGRGSFRQFEPEMDASAQARRALEIDLRAALPRGEFELYYQPLLDLRADAVSGFEALLRWRHPERGFVSPAEFIPLAEEIGLINAIGDWVLRTACAQAATWPRHLKIAVNLSPVQFRSGSLVTAVIQAIAATGLLPRQLELEVTESVLLECSQTNLEQLHQLRALGVRIAMDDFGTGYSSLSYLRSFPFDKIKIDRSFVRGSGDGQGRAIVRAVAGLGASLGICTTAEGVETPDELDLARAEGCTEVQGYLISRPRPSGEIAAMIARIERGLPWAA